MRNASRESFRSHTLQIGDDVVQILITQQGVVINRHQGFAALLDRAHFVFFEQMNFLVCIHHLQAEVVLVKSNAFDLLPSAMTTVTVSYSWANSFVGSVNPQTSFWLGFRTDSIKASTVRAVPTPVRSGPTRPPLPSTMWHKEQFASP